MQRKKELASERRERFQTGGGVMTEVLKDNPIDSILSMQTPIQNVLDDDHVDSGYSIVWHF